MVQIVILVLSSLASTFTKWWFIHAHNCVLGMLCLLHLPPQLPLLLPDTGVIVSREPVAYVQEDISGTLNAC